MKRTKNKIAQILAFLLMTGQLLCLPAYASAASTDPKADQAASEDLCLDTEASETITIEALEEKASKCNTTYWIGDSRVCCIYLALNGTYYPSLDQVAFGNVFFTSYEGQGYYWYSETPRTQLRENLEDNPTANVVFSLGVNDLDNIHRYIAEYQSLLEDYPQAHFYFLAVMPIDEDKTYWRTRNSDILSYNEELYAAVPDQYVDMYAYLTDNGFETNDGIHYSDNTSMQIFDHVLRIIDEEGAE